MNNVVGKRSKVIHSNGDTKGYVKILAHDPDMMKFHCKWISPKEKEGQEEIIAYCWLSDILRS